ncbi:Cyclic di-GMP phosphodiesterase response regulator RpfG [bioreactor metagenome]|uniref:Cyclic di-GMP phosphodiesterase response regulator RpfG n=1 Tax=bioreactor metagenome TaxID=1076179 RepID=A0A645EA86_9ZZZZ
MKNQELLETYQQLRESYLQTVGALRLIVDAKDIYTRGHSDRVSYFCKLVADHMHKDADYIKRIGLSGLFHDVGKVGVADDILLKEKHLTGKEYDEIKKHAQRGANILSAISFLDDISLIVKHHHERWDGLGYPSGLRGTDIPEESRIIAVADAFDAMTSERVYRNRLSLEEAKQELVKGKANQFDPQIVDVFLEILLDYDQICQQISWTYDEIDMNHVHAIY